MVRVGVEDNSGRGATAYVNALDALRRGIAFRITAAAIVTLLEQRASIGVVSTKAQLLILGLTPKEVPFTLRLSFLDGS